MPTPDQLGNASERFYIESIKGKKGNLFNRVEWLEKALKKLQVGDVTNFVTQVIQENKEIIQPSVSGGISDPNNPAFSGIVISPNGQLIGGVLYSFAIVENGVVVQGFGDSGGTPVVVTGGDVIGDSSISSMLAIPLFNSTDGKHIYDGGLFPGTLAAYGSVFYFDNTAADVSGYKTLNKTFSTLLAGTTTKACTLAGNDFETIEEFISPAIDFPHLIEGIYTMFFYASADVSQSVEFQCSVYLRNSVGSETFLYDTVISYASITNVPSYVMAWNVWSHVIFDPTDRLVIKVNCRVSADANITLHFGDNAHPSYFSHPMRITDTDGVRSVTGSGVDNTDPSNPVISPVFNRVLTGNLTLYNTQSLVVTGYLDAVDYDVDLQGDSVIEII